MLKPHDAATGQVLIYTGAVPCTAARVNATGAFVAGQVADVSKASGWMTKTVIKTFDVDAAGSDDYLFDNTANNKTEQVKTLANILPAYAELVSWQVRCTETVTGGAALTVDSGHNVRRCGAGDGGGGFHQ